MSSIKFIELHRINIFNRIIKYKKRLLIQKNEKSHIILVSSKYSAYLQNIHIIDDVKTTKNALYK